MPDMYDKLGDLLNEALKSGEIPNQKPAQADTVQADVAQADDLEDRNNHNENHDDVNNDETCDKSGLFSFNSFNKEKIRLKIPKKEKKICGQVVKLHKYTENMQFPPQIQNALTTLDIAYPITTTQIKKQYRKILKITHPDTKNTIQQLQGVNFNRQYTIDEIKSAYNLLCNYFDIK